VQFLTRRAPAGLATRGDLDASDCLERAADQAMPQDQVRYHAVGQRPLLPARVVPALAVAVQATRTSEALVCTVCLADGARQALVEAIQCLRIDPPHGTRSLEDLGAARVAQSLDTRGMPDPARVLRPAGEERVSHVFLWPLAAAALCGLVVLWPACRTHAVLRALCTSQGRQWPQGASPCHVRPGRGTGTVP